MESTVCHEAPTAEPQNKTKKTNALGLLYGQQDTRNCITERDVSPVESHRQRGLTPPHG